MFYLNCIAGSKIYREEIEIKVVAIPHSEIYGIITTIKDFN